MEFILAAIIILCNIQYNDVMYNKVHVMELNHCIRAETKTYLDQIVYYNCVRSNIQIVDYQLIINGRENLTEEEYNRKNRELGDAFLKERPNFKGKLPQYVPQFIGNIRCPRKIGKYWIMTLIDDGILYKIYSDSYFESYTNYDVEEAGRKNFPVSKRKRLTKWPR